LLQERDLSCSTAVVMVAADAVAEWHVLDTLHLLLLLSWVKLHHYVVDFDIVD